jgi:hypothetical protein
MQNRYQTLVSAQVVLRPSSIAASDEVALEFASAGFAVGALVANNFSVSGSVAKFESYFHVNLEPVPGAGIRIRRAEQPAGFQLPLDALPASVRGKVETVIFVKPPDFGPTGAF